MVILYHSGLSTCSKQTRLCLREKGVSYESRYVELWRYENYNPAYLKLNPNGVVPTLVHDGKAFYNSLAIMEYIDDAFDGPALSPATAADRWNMRQWMWTADMIHLAVQDATYAAVLQDKVDDLSDDEKAQLIKAVTVPDRRARWMRATEGGFSQPELEKCDNMFTWGIEKAEEQLAQTAWLAGEDYSLADIAMISIIHRIREIRPALVGENIRPAVAAWHDAVKARDATTFVYTNGTEETPPRPAGKSIEGLTHWPWN